MSSTQSAEQLLQHMMTQYCVLESSTVYPDMKKLRELLALLSDEQKLHILQQRYSVCGTPLRYAAGRDHKEIISTLLTSLQSSADRLKLLMVDKSDTTAYSSVLGLHRVSEDYTGLSNSLSADTDHVYTEYIR